ncbi:MAG TPA: fumarate hydratase [Clostridiales bacterium]|nr:fumarate hydratase [Clostridiales bacterium]
MVREISAQALSQLVAQLCVQANTVLPQDMRQAICQACQGERSPVGQRILHDMQDNYHIAQEEGLPICQDTGMAVVFVDWGQDCHLTGGTLEEAVNQGVAQGYVEGHLRLSVVGDPLRRVNTNNNTPAMLHLRMVPGDQVRVTVAPKGFGSENMTRLKMFKPSATLQEVEDFVVECVSMAGSNPCPPVVVGVGLGGTSEMSALLAKRALLRPAGAGSDDPYYREMEGRLLERINRLGIGPQGLGGTVTALSVAILPCATHIAGLPCCVNLGCHVTRHAEGIL